MMMQCKLACLGFFTLTLATLGSAHAGGFYISEIGTPGSLGTAGAANSTNNFGPDSAWTNPAGMTGLDQDASTFGLQTVLPYVQWESDIATGGGSDGGNVGIPSAIPSFFYVKTLGERARLGFSVVAPLGGGSDYGGSFVGRYIANRVELAGVGMTPSFAYKVNDRLSLGAGLSLIYTRLDMDISLNQAAIVPGLPDGQVSLDGIDDLSWQGTLGLTYQLNDRTLLGVVYRSQSEVELEGDIAFSGIQIPIINTLTSNINEAKVAWDNPQLLEVGLRYEYSDDLYLMFNADWEDWSAFSNNRVSISTVGGAGRLVNVDRNWKDTWHVGAAFAKRLKNDAGFSMGVSYDSSPVDDADRTLDLPVDRQIKLSMAFTNFDSKRDFRYSIGATLIHIGNNEVDQTAQGVRVKGEFKDSLIMFLGGSLRYDF
jgi:long-chain fatty acid transport protein